MERELKDVGAAENIDEKFGLLTADNIHSELGLLLGILDQTTATWRRELEWADEGAVLWQPYEGGQSIGVLILHMADAENFWIKQVGSGVPLTAAELQEFLSKETRQDEGIWPKPPDRPLSWYYAQHDRIRAQTREIVSRLNDPLHKCTRADYPNRDFTLRWLLAHIIQHDAYHGGQAVMLSLMRVTMGK